MLLKLKTYTVWSVRLAFLALWVPVAVDKLWDLQGVPQHAAAATFPRPVGGCAVLVAAAIGTAGGRAHRLAGKPEAGTAGPMVFGRTHAGLHAVHPIRRTGVV